MRRPPVVLWSTIIVLSAVSACDDGDGRTLEQPTPEQRVQATNEAATTTTAAAGSGIETAAPETTAVAESFILTAPWAEGTAVDPRYTCDGEDVSPALSWTAPPNGTVDLALVMSDDDVNFVHWAITGLPPSAGSLDEGAVPAGAIEAVNDFGEPGWGGPCPPEGQTHTYRFQLYALTAPAGVEPGASAREVVSAIEAIQSSIAVVTGTYGRA